MRLYQSKGTRTKWKKRERLQQAITGSFPFMEKGVTSAAKSQFKKCENELSAARACYAAQRFLFFFLTFNNMSGGFNGGFAAGEAAFFMDNTPQSAGPISMIAIEAQYFDTKGEQWCLGYENGWGAGDVAKYGMPGSATNPT